MPCTQQLIQRYPELREHIQNLGTDNLRLATEMSQQRPDWGWGADCSRQLCNQWLPEGEEDPCPPPLPLAC
ncbi:hypothetical protein B3C1_00415 [Gallaecimonas xiamenensis 3-C-1]|uniref:Uncharacterized protein n=2 Tax=Gallaecimonas TaxID=745410 RepID=K2JTL7_9GAMM|nr:hypothetical protein B3C1_00415 [Gallaecimonas xiamenensis 3-C-1]